MPGVLDVQQSFDSINHNQSLTKFDLSGIMVLNGTGSQIKQQAITSAYVDSDQCRHMASLGHNELTTHTGIPWRLALVPISFLLFIDELPHPSNNAIIIKAFSGDSAVDTAGTLFTDTRNELHSCVVDDARQFNNTRVSVNIDAKDMYDALHSW